MNKLTLKILTGVILASSLTQTALASGSPFEGTSIQPFLSTYLSTFGLAVSTDSSWHKVILDAKEDAATFVISEGQIRGVGLQKAFEMIRQIDPKMKASDLDLAEAILAE